MLKQFKVNFVPPGNTAVLFGDWSQKHHMPYKEPTIGKCFREILSSAGYPVFLANEYLTSAKCSACVAHGRCIKFRKCRNPRPWKR
jgi:hypothetical protein